ncbi:MAG: aldo/keto reductase [Blautia sp.]|nr:aldo/keto reductase [Eubacteriales bacterium]MED9967274.1 aldo/keto reductase [Blautia sp.]
MDYVTLGKTGLKISRMGFGGIPIQRIDAQGTKELIHKMADAGVNYIDTARGYTVSEEYLGHALEGVRDKFVLATKSMARTKDAMAADIEKSLDNLRTEYIDLYQVHNPSMEQLEQVMGEGGALEALKEAQAAGKIGHIGLTAHSAAVFERALELGWVETIMFPYNIVESQGEELIARCKEKNIGFIAMKPLAGGAIENASLAIRYICANDNVTVVIPGMAEEKELEQNLRACLDASPLSEEERKEIAGIREQLGSNFCRRCNYCAPCTAGINIPSVFLFAGYLERYDLGDWARDRYNSLAVKASACVECGECETRCPYHLPIREMLKKCAQEFGE